MTIAVYPGSFDPVTLGHIDIALRAANSFDRIIMLVGRNPAKSGAIKYGMRVKLIEEAVKEMGISNITADDYAGYIVDYCDKVGATVIIRGMRSITDFDEELQMANINRKLNGKVETFLIPAKPELSDLSSSVVRQLWNNNRDIENMVPKAVFNYLKSACWSLEKKL